MGYFFSIDMHADCVMQKQLEGARREAIPVNDELPRYAC